MLNEWSICYIHQWPLHLDFHFDLFAGETTILELFTLSRINDLEPELIRGWQLGYRKQTTVHVPLNGCPELYILYMSKNYTSSAKGEIMSAYWNKLSITVTPLI